MDLGEELAALFGNPVAVAVDVQAAALAGTVMGEDDVGPLARREPLRVVGIDRDTGRAPARPGPVAVEAEVQLACSERDLPATIGVVGVALAGDGVAALGLRHVDPERQGERRVGVEFERREFGRGLVLEAQRRQTVRSGFDPDCFVQVDRLAFSIGDYRRRLPLEIEPQDLGSNSERRFDLAMAVARKPLGKRRFDRVEALRHRVLELADLCAQPVPGVAVLVPRHHQGRRRVRDVAVHHVLRGVPEERRQRVELSGADGVELVVVAGRAADGQPQEHAADRLGAVLRVDRLVFLDQHAAFVGRDVVALEAGGDQLVEGRVFQQVAGDLVDRELVERLVPVERLDDPVPVGVHLPVVVVVDAVGVPVAGGVEPVAGAVLAPVGRVEEPVHEPLVGALVCVVEEGGERARIGRQAGQVEGGATSQGSPVGLLGRVEFLRF